MSESSPTPFEEFGALAVLFGRTRAALHGVLRRGAADDAAAQVLVDETLPHIEGVEAGFRARLRASDWDLPELRGLVAFGGLAIGEPANDAERRAQLIESMRALKGAGGPPDLTVAPGAQLAAMEHARIAMAMLPATSARAVRFPGRRSYADIAAPRTPSEFVARIEEVERIVWRVAARRRSRHDASALRRTYAFFDAGEHLSGDGLTHA